MKIPNSSMTTPPRTLSLARIVSEDSQQWVLEAFREGKSSKDS